MSRLAKQFVEKSTGSFVANTEKNPKEECKAIFTRSQRRESSEKETRVEGVLEDVSDEEGEEKHIEKVENKEKN